MDEDVVNNTKVLAAAADFVQNLLTVAGGEDIARGVCQISDNYDYVVETILSIFDTELQSIVSNAPQAKTTGAAV